MPQVRWTWQADRSGVLVLGEGKDEDTWVDPKKGNAVRDPCAAAWPGRGGDMDHVRVGEQPRADVAGGLRLDPARPPVAEHARGGRLPVLVRRLQRLLRAEACVIRRGLA